jgi:hypothetical protein
MTCLGQLRSHIWEGWGLQLSLVNTRVVAEEIHAVEGYAAFDARRQSKHSKQIAGNVMIGSKGFDDGLDHVMS